MAQRWKISTDPRMPYVFLDGGYAIPSGFTVTAERGGLQVELRVAIASGRARTTHVAVSTDAGGGVTSTTLRQVPIRDLVATGVRRLLCQVVPEASEATATIVPVRTWGEAEVSATKQLVGYIDVSGAR